MSFALHGDSGSIVVDSDNRAIGLLISVTREASAIGSDVGFLSYACHIVPVLDELGICIPTTGGTEHGSSLATDGSGLALYDGPLELPADDGRVIFSAHGAAGARVTGIPSPPGVTPFTDEQRASLMPLLDALRETERGRELHEAFAQLRRELVYLVRTRRPVKVAWHRNRGPAFLACLLNHLKDEAAVIPREIGGVSRATLLERMGQLFSEQGSDALREAIRRHRDVVMLLADAETVQECFEILRRAETVEATT